MGVIRSISASIRNEFARGNCHINGIESFRFLTNNFAIPAQTVADLYRYRWQVELFFRWIKQHLRI